MKETKLDYDQGSENSDISQNTELKVFRQYNSVLKNETPYVKKLSSEQKVESTQHSTLRSEREKKEPLMSFLKEEKNLKKKILNQKLDSKMELQNVAIDEEVDSYSIKSDKLEEFPLSFRPTGLVYRESLKDNVYE